MKRSTLIIAAALVLTAGIIAIAVGLGPTPEDKRTGKTDGPPPREGREAGTAAFQAGSTGKTAPRTERETANEDLVESYGDARTKLARNVSENVVGLLDDVISMGEMMMGGESGAQWNRGDWQVRRLLRGTEIELTDEQRERANQLLADYRQRELERTKNAVSQLREDPTPLMGLLLAGDARSRDELSEADYASLQQANAEALGDIINPLDRNNFRGGQPLEDDTFRRDFESLLEPDQAQAFREAQQADDPGEAAESAPSNTNITAMPVMDLESADEAIRSTRQMTAGFKQVMEGMGNLGPLLEQQRRTGEIGE